ncbi:MAG: hypothetical protein IMZ61_05090 [Planctomycetes bacterium]|nr:hypothetical protein [Planctomycetota bacterium]
MIVRRDLPLETHYRTVETPNWGDSWKGYHDVELPYEAYPREYLPPKEIELLMKSAASQPGLDQYVISFRVNEVLNRKSRKFKSQLLWCLNLLQENVGACGVEASRTSLETYTKSLHLSWEILPPGTREEAVARIFQSRKASPEHLQIASDRYDFFMTLHPEKLVYGSSGFRRYFGALIQENLVLFENIEYGNAVYVMFDNWEELSKRSRLELLSGKFGEAFERVPHNKGWKKQVKVIIKQRRSK